MEVILVNVIVKLSWLSEFNNKIILQFGSVSGGSGSALFPIAFTTYVSVIVEGYIQNAWYLTTSKTITNFNWSYGYVNNPRFVMGNWIAIGY